LAELTTPAKTTTNSCCAPQAQATCCEPRARAKCCGPSHGEGCGCAADTTTTQAATYPNRCASAASPPLALKRTTVDGVAEEVGLALALSPSACQR
jgi:hypothetical protein